MQHEPNAPCAARLRDVARHCGIERRSACRCRTKERPPDALRAWCPIAGGGRSWVTVMVCPAVTATATRGWFGCVPGAGENAIVGIDLADRKQMVVVTDHDSKVLARRTFRCRAWDLGAALDWAGERAAAKGWAGVTVACEPTGHRWRVLGQLAADRDAVRVRAADADLVGAAHRGPDLRQDR